MAEFRQGYLDDYSQNNTGVGIGTSSPTEAKLEIVGGTTSQELNVTGISTFTHVSGFIKKHTDYAENVNITAGDSGTLSGEIVVGAGLTMTVGTSVTTSQGSVDSLKVSNMFQPPSGTTNTRPPGKPGALFYNFDFKTIEFFDGNSWVQVDNTTRRGRGVFFGGEQKGGAVQAGLNDFVNIMSLGNSLSFGDLSTGVRSRLETAGASSTRGVFGCGKTPSDTDIIDYITIASEGTAIDFGNAKQANTIQNGGTKSSSTRGIFGGGTPTELQYIEISTLGSTSDFGDLQKSNGSQGSSSSSPTRAVFLADSGHTGGTIEAVTISTTGSATTFGKFMDSKSNASGAGNGVRGVFAGAYKPGDTKISLIEYANMSSLGNTNEFGDLSVNRACHRACATNTRALFGGGYFTTTPTATGGTGDNRIEFVTIATTGNAFDFGDTTSGMHHARGASLSDSHGGLGGF